MLGLPKYPAATPRLRPLLRGRLLLLASGLLVTLLAAFFLYYPPELLRFFDFRIYDTLLSLPSERGPQEQPLVVGIDEESLSEFGQWPWPRYRLAQLLNELQRQGVAAVGLDILMPEEDRTSPEVILRERRRDLGEERSAADWLQVEKQNDQVLAEALSGVPAVLGFKFIYAADEPLRPQTPFLPLTQIVVRSSSGRGRAAAEPRGMLQSREVLTRQARRHGFVNAAPDRDGILRRAPLLLRHRDGYYPSLALATVIQALGERKLQLDLLGGEARLSLGQQQVPLDSRGNLLLGFSTRLPYRYISAADLLLKRVPVGRYAGAVAFVGAQAAGLGDRHATPLDRSFPGLGIHALVAASLLNGDWVAHPLWAQGLELLFVLFLGGFSALLLSRFGLLTTLLLVVGGTCAVILLSVEMFRESRYFISPTLPILVLLANAGLLSLIKYGIEASNLRQRNLDLLKAQDATIVSLTILADTRDSDTGAHILRTQRYVEALARQLLSQNPRGAKEIAEADIEMLFKSAPLHDIGKVGIPDRILLKRGELDAEEVEIMRSHARIGAMALARTAEVLEHPESYAFLGYARQMAESHHERWDGSGYPYGLVGEAIPLAGRLMSLADVYDALRSRRPYKEPVAHAQAREYILSRSGELFDPEVVAAFVACDQEFQHIADCYQDGQGLSAAELYRQALS